MESFEKIPKEIISHQLSRMILMWPKYYIYTDCPKNIPLEIYLLLSKFPQLILAGGALVSILNYEIPRDWDLFIVGTIDDMNNILDYVRKFDIYYETQNSISIDNIQIIKRLYNDPMHIIGGFDLDPCRLYWDMHNDRIITTYSGYMSIETCIVNINPWCASETMPDRIRKYRNKGYNIAHIYGTWYKPYIFRNNRSYNISRNKCPIALIAYPADENLDILSNVAALLKRDYHKLYTRGYIYSLDEMLIAYDNVKNKKYTNIHFTMYDTLYRLHGPYGVYVKYESNKSGITCKYNISNPEYINKLTALAKSLIIKRYHHYSKVTNSMIINTHTQFTGSFYPITHKIYKYNKNTYVSKKYKYVLYLLLSKCIKYIPRPIRIMIAIYLIELY